MCKTVGHLLENSGWTTVIMNAGVTRSGVAQALDSGHDVVQEQSMRVKELHVVSKY